MSVGWDGKEKHMKKISTIKANKGFNEFGKRILKQRICAYCRVSTHHLLQKESLDAQMDHYTSYIENNPEWEFAGIYADEGISGKGKKQRTEFLRMIKDAENDKFDLILTKSISRFARNTSECIGTIRHLKGLNIGVYFEKENINTLNAESELMLSILSSVAEAELLSASQNMKWSITRQFSQGKVQVCTGRFMGYDKDDNGNLVINEEQAKIVRRIFEDYIGGLGASKIAKALEADGVEKITGGVNWSASVILGMLKNEKYAGDALLQKTITVNSISLKRKKNEGEAPQYYVKDSHPAIISKEQFEKAQELMVERGREKGNTSDMAWKYNQRYTFTSKLECGRCGRNFKRTIHNSNNGKGNYRWTCGTYIDKGVKACSIGALKDDTIKSVFLRIINRLIADKEPLNKYLQSLEEVHNDTSLGRKLKEYEEEISKLLKQEGEMFLLQVRGYVDKEIFKQEHMELVERIEELQEETMAIKNIMQRQDDSYQNTASLITILNKLKRVEEFSDELFETIVDKIVVKERECLIFQLQGGLQLEERYTLKYGTDIV